MATRHASRLRATAFAAVVLAAAFVAMPCAAAAVTSCEGVADGTPCDENGDGCFYDDGDDKCLAGVCASPPPCDRTTFTALPGGVVRMDWSKDPSLVTPGEFCEGKASVPVELVEQITGAVPPSDHGFIQITRTKNARKLVPPAGKVRLKLHLNNLGRYLKTHAAGAPLRARVRMALTKPNGGPTVAANRLIMLLARRLH